MEHRQTIPEHMDSSEPAAFEDLSPASRFQKRQARQHDYARAQIERMRDESINNLERRIGENALGADRHVRHCQKVDDEVQRKSIVDDIAGNHLAPVGAQYVDDAGSINCIAGRRSRSGMCTARRNTSCKST
jgi:hypothetical protein